METTTRTVEILPFRKVADGGHDGNRVYVWGPYRTEEEPAWRECPAYQRVIALPGAVVLYEDRGDYGPCALSGKDGHRHSGYRVEEDGTKTFLPVYSSWRAAKIGASALVAGLSPTGPEAWETEWQERRKARRR